MKKFTNFSLIFLFTVSTLFVNAQIIQWVEHFGASDFDDISNNVVVEGDFIYVTGSFTSPTLTFPTTGTPITLTNSGGSDMFVAQFDMDGNCEWAKNPIGTPNCNDYGMDVAVDPEGFVWVIGSFKDHDLDFGSGVTLTHSGGSDFYIAKFDMWGWGIVWAESNSAGGLGNDYGEAITFDWTAREMYIIGSFESANLGFSALSLTNTSILPSVSDVFIAKITNILGVPNFNWAENPNGDGDDYGTDIDFCTPTATATSSCYVTGYFNSDLLVFLGGISLNNISVSGTNDIFVAAYSVAGAASWADRPIGFKDDYCRSIAVDETTGDVFITGDFKSDLLNFGPGISLLNPTIGASPTSNYFIAKYDDPVLGSGIAEWAKTADANSIDYLHNFDDVGKSIVTDTCGNAYVTGWYNSSSIDFGTNPGCPILLTNETNSNYSEIFIAKYNTNGVIQWIYEGKEVFNDHGTGIAIQYGECDCPIITGWYESKLNLAGTFVAHSGPDETKDFYLAHICNYNCCQPLPCENPILLHTGEGIPDIGVTDPNWTITNPVGEIATTCIWHDLGWSYGPPFTGTQWISIDSIPTADLGTYTFERTFYIVPCIEPELCICVLVDDIADIYLNDVHIGSANSMYTPSVINAAGYGPFITGLNTLKVIVNNTIESQMAFDLEGYYCCSSFPNPCNYVSVNYQQLDSCCYDIYLENTQPETYITQIQFTTSNGYPSLNPIISTIPSGWTYTPSTFPSNILTLYPATGSSGTFLEYFELYLENDPVSNPQQINIEWIGYDYNQDTLICYDTLYLECPDTCECEICENPIHTITTGPGAPGSISANWTLITAPPGIATPAPAINMGVIPGAWGGPFTGTNWISYIQNGGGGAAPTGLYEYQNQFLINDTCPNNMDMFLRICLLVDDTATIKLNGALVGIATSEIVPFMGDFYGLPINVGGMNTLSIEVINDPGYYTGFDLKAWICCGDPIPVTYCGDTICDWNDPARFGNLISTYSCPGGTTITDNGPEAVFTFNLPASSVVTAELISGPAFFDIFILDTYPAGPVKACGTSTSPAIAFLAPGTYFIVVDSPNWGDIDQFCFTLECDTCEDCEPLCEDPIDLLHTGTVPIGNPDPNWRITVDPSGGGVPRLATTANWAGLGWSPPMPGTNWISISDTASATTGTYVFEHEFFIDSLCVCPSLRICIMVDDTANIYLNGNFIGTWASQHNIKTFNHTHTITAPFIIDDWNTLSVEVINNPANYTGINIKGWVCCCECEDTEVRKWYFYQNAGLEFIPPDPPVVPDWTTATLPGGMISTTLGEGEGCSVIHDSLGNLLFYTDGVTIWDRNNIQMLMWDGTPVPPLLGSFSSTQSALIVPQPCNDSIYYVFTTGDWGGTSGLNYTIVNIKGNGGLGGVTSINNNLLSANISTEKLTYAHHENGIDVWILTHGYGGTNSDAFYAYKLTCEGISAPVISNVGCVFSNYWNRAGYLEANPQGDLLATAIYTNSVNSFEVFDFNNNNGEVGLIGSFGSSGASSNYGVEFSPNGRQLYVSTFDSLWQIPVTPGTPGTMGTQILIATTSTSYDFGAMQRGPDGKIYIARNGSTSIDVINDPNLPGLACGYDPLSVPIAEDCRLGLPACYSKKCKDYLTQCCDLALGYSFMSSRIIPENPDMLNILSDNLDNLDFVRNTAGFMVHKIGPWWVNSIGDWITTEGYLFRMNTADELCITGYVIDPQTPIPLVTGYQFISYLPENPMNALDVFADVLANLDFVRNTAGQMLIKIGPIWVNGIGDMNPCEGYLVKMFAADVLIYPETSDNLITNKTPIPEHYRVIDANPYDPVWTIYFEKGTLNIGDEIGVYDGEILAGAGVVFSDNILGNSIPVFSNLYKIGNYPIFKVWNKNEKEEFLLTDYSYINPYGDAYIKEVFPETDGEYSLLHFSTTGISDENVVNDITIYPNPAKDVINIVSDEIINKIEILNLLGQNLITSVENSRNIRFNVEAFTPGIYLIKIYTSNNINIKRFTIN